MFKRREATTQKKWLNELKRAYGIDRVEDLRRHALDRGGDLEAEDLGLLVVGREELAGVDGVDDLPGVCQLDPVANALPEQWQMQS